MGAVSWTRRKHDAHTPHSRSIRDLLVRWQHAEGYLAKAIEYEQRVVELRKEQRNKEEAERQAREEEEERQRLEKEREEKARRAAERKKKKRRSRSRSRSRSPKYDGPLLTDAEWRRKWDLEDMERGRSILSEEEHRRRMGEALAAASLRAAQGRQDVEAEMAKRDQKITELTLAHARQEIELKTMQARLRSVCSAAACSNRRLAFPLL